MAKRVSRLVMGLVAFWACLFEPVVAAEAWNAKREAICERQAQAVIEALNDRLSFQFTPSERGIVRATVFSACTDSAAVLQTDARGETAGGDRARSAKESEETTSKGDDWFTEYLLKGKAPNKAGNKRLKRRSSR